MIRALLFLLLFALHGLSWAYPATTNSREFRVGNSGSTTLSKPWSSSASAACTYYVGWAHPAGYTGTVSGTDNGQAQPYSPTGVGFDTALMCQIKNATGGLSQQVSIYSRYAAAFCPAGGSLTGGQCVCAAGETDTGSSCQASPCTAGTTTTLNPTTGYGWITGYSDGLAIVKGAPGRVSGDGNTAPASLCDGTCAMTATGPAEEFWVSQNPGPTGMHRISVLQTYTRTGATCASPSPDLDANLTASCPGTMGTFNGKPVCLATSTTDSGSGSGTPLKPGTNVGDSPAPGGVPDSSKVGGDGQLGGGSSKPPSGSAGGSTPGSKGGTVVGGGTSITVTTSSNGETSTSTMTWGDVKEGDASGVPTIYERKYKKSPGEYFNERMASVSGRGSQFINAAFAPPWSDNPSLCPKWSLPGGSIGPWSLGLGDVSVPCNVWAFCRVVIILSALFLARALVFGG